MESAASESVESFYFSFVFILFVSVLVIVFFVRWIKNYSKQDEEYDTSTLSLFGSSHTTVGAQKYIHMVTKFKKHEKTYDEVKDNNSEDRKAIGAALLKRMMADVEVIAPFEEERSGVLQAHKSGFLPADEWKAFLKANEYIHVELETVKQEAGQLKDGWEDTIISQAVQLVATTNQKKAMADYMQKQEIQKKKEERIQEKKKIAEELENKKRMEIQTRKAAKIAEELIQEEEEVNKKKKK